MKTILSIAVIALVSLTQGKSNKLLTFNIKLLTLNLLGIHGL